MPQVPDHFHADRAAPVSGSSGLIRFATLTGLPATTAPVGITRADVPVGIQIMGPYLEDATPIDIAGWLPRCSPNRL
jgi:Asp-tRNA(Asn)/Glu-tRNA(Gln) amidotransferase A subunit family amidase